MSVWTHKKYKKELKNEKVIRINIKLKRLHDSY